MPILITGTAVDPTTSPQATGAADGDAGTSAALAVTPLQAVLNFISWLRTNIAGLGLNNTFTGTNTFNGATNVAVPTSAANPLRKDSPVSTATASTPVGRDANGRAQFADPAVAADAATKGYVDGASDGVALGANWTGNVTTWSAAGMHFFAINATAAAGASWSALTGTLPNFIGIRPYWTGEVKSGTNRYLGKFVHIGTLQVDSVLVAGVLSAPPAIQVGDNVVATGMYHG